MGSHRDLKLLELVDQIVADVTLLATGGSTRLLFKGQLLDSVESVSANIGEAFGRGTKPDRNRALFVARGEAEEAIRHLLPNRVAKRVATRDYWRIDHRLVLAVKMIDAIMRT